METFLEESEDDGIEDEEEDTAGLNLAVLLYDLELYIHFHA